MTLSELKKYIELAETKYRENPTLQKLVNTAGAAGIGYGLGSIRLGNDPNSRLRGYLFSRDKGVSRNIGALAGALAGLHAPMLSKKAEAQGMAKHAFSLADVNNMLSNANNWYKSQRPEIRALIGAGVGLGGGALLGGSRKSALLGALAGAGTGAYWNDVLKAIDAIRPVAGNAAQRTRAYLAGLLPQGIKSEDEKATEVANAAAGV